MTKVVVSTSRGRQQEVLDYAAGREFFQQRPKMATVSVETPAGEFIMRPTAGGLIGDESEPE
eukprot:5222528-Lingulodinium_polyedra.AAC.1